VQPIKVAATDLFEDFGAADDVVSVVDGKHLW